MFERGCKAAEKGPLSAGLFFVRRSTRWPMLGSLSINFYLLLASSAALYLLSPLFHPQLGAIGHNDQRAIVTVLIALGGGLFAIQSLLHSLQPPRPRLEHIIWLMVLLGTTASATAAFPLRALFEVCLYLCLVYSARVIYSRYRTLDYNFVFSALSNFAVVLVLVYAVAFIFSYGTWLVLPEFYCNSCVLPNFDNMRAFNDVQVWLLPFLWYFALQERSTSSRKVLALAPAVFFSTLLFYTTARGATLALMVAIVFVGLRYRSRAKEFAVAAAITVTLGWLFNLLLTRLLPFLVDRPLPRDILDRLSSGTSGRTELWQAAMDMLLHNPWFGVGPQHYAHQLSQNYEHIKPFGSPHNMFLTFLAEWGLVAGSLISLGILWFLYTVIRGRATAISKDASQAKQVAEATAIAVLVSSMFAGTLLSPLSQMMLVLFAPALLLPGRGALASNNNPGRQEARGKSYGYAALLLCAALFLLGMTVYDIVVHRDVIFLTTETAYPRYWQNGFFWRY